MKPRTTPEKRTDIKMDIKCLEDFLSVVETRNFSRSAQERNVTQPAFSRRIRALEAWVGADLVDRSTVPLTLTAEGKLFSESAHEAVRLLSEARVALGAGRKEKSTLRITAAHTLSLHFIPAWLKCLQSRGRGGRTRVRPATVHDSILSLVEKQSDLILCYSHPDVPIELDSTRFSHVVIGKERLVPVSIPAQSGGPEFPLPGSSAVPTRAIGYTANSYFRRVVHRITVNASQRSNLVNVYESDMAELVKGLVLSGEGLAWLPESCVAQELHERRLVSAGGNQWAIELEICLCRAKDNQLPALEELWNTALAT